MTNSQRMRDEAGDQVLGHAVGEVLLIGIAAHVVERQHRDRGAVGQRQSRASLSTVLPAAGADLADKTVAAAVQRLDVARFAGVVPRALRSSWMQVTSAASPTVTSGHTAANNSSLVMTSPGRLGDEGERGKRLGREPHLAAAGHQSAARLETIASERKCPIRHAFLRRRG